MAKPSKKQKGTSSRSQRHSETQETSIPSSIPSASLFSFEEQRIRYTNLFSSRSIIDPKFIDMDFFSNESFECIQAFENSNLIPFMSLKLPVYSDLVKAFYSNLEIQEGTLISEVYGIKMVIDQSLFYELTQLSNEGVPFEGTLIDDWKYEFSVHDARQLVCTNQADMTGRLLVGSLAFESRILHYLIVCILLPRSSNLAQVSEEDLIVMWTFHKGLQIDWEHLVRYRMHKALRLNAPLPYPHLVTLSLQHFNIPLDSEPYVPIKRGYISCGSILVEGTSTWLFKENKGGYIPCGSLLVKRFLEG